MLFFHISHAAKDVHTITKHVLHRSGASDEPHDAPRPVQHANLMHVKHTHSRPSRSSQTPDHMPTNAPPLEACLQATAPLHPRRILFSKPPRQLGARPRKEPVRTRSGSDKLSSKWRDNCTPTASREGFHGRSGHPRDSYHLRAAILEILTIYGAKTGLNPKTRDTKHAPPGPFCVGPTSRSDPTLGQCFYTTFGMHTVHLNNGVTFRLSSDAPPAALAAP